MRKRVFDRMCGWRRGTSKFNRPVVVICPRLLKRKREGDNLNDSYDGDTRLKRIRFCPRTGAVMNPQFSDKQSDMERSELTEKVTFKAATNKSVIDTPVTEKNKTDFPEDASTLKYLVSYL